MPVSRTDSETRPTEPLVVIAPNEGVDAYQSSGDRFGGVRPRDLVSRLHNSHPDAILVIERTVPSADETGSLDEKGRVRIPTSIRKRLRLEPGDAVSIGMKDGTIIVRPEVERDDFIETMRGCVNAGTRRREPGSLSPDNLEDDWTGT